MSLTSAVRLSCVHIYRLVQTNPNFSKLKDQKTGDESPLDMDILLIDDMCFLWLLKLLLERFDLLAKSILEDACVPSPENY